MPESSFLNPAKVIAAAGVHEGMRVADFGAGSGFFTRAAARAVGPQGVVWAVDIHRDMLPHIKNLAAGEGLHNIEVVRGDVARKGGSHLPDASFDLVIISNVLFSTDEKEREHVLAEAVRVLRQGGRVLLVDWEGSFDGMGPHPDHVVTRATAEKFLKKEGFTVLQEINSGSYHWGLTVRKTAHIKAQ